MKILRDGQGLALFMVIFVMGAPNFDSILVADNGTLIVSNSNFSVVGQLHSLKLLEP